MKYLILILITSCSYTYNGLTYGPNATHAYIENHSGYSNLKPKIIEGLKQSGYDIAVINDQTGAIESNPQYVNSVGFKVIVRADTNGVAVKGYWYDDRQWIEGKNTWGVFRMSFKRAVKVANKMDF